MQGELLITNAQNAGPERELRLAKTRHPPPHPLLPYFIKDKNKNNKKQL